MAPIIPMVFIFRIISILFSQRTSFFYHITLSALGASTPPHFLLSPWTIFRPTSPKFIFFCGKPCPILEVFLPYVAKKNLLLYTGKE